MLKVVQICEESWPSEITTATLEKKQSGCTFRQKTDMFRYRQINGKKCMSKRGLCKQIHCPGWLCRNGRESKETQDTSKSFSQSVILFLYLSGWSGPKRCVWEWFSDFLLFCSSVTFPLTHCSLILTCMSAIVSLSCPVSSTFTVFTSSMFCVCRWCCFLFMLEDFLLHTSMPPCSAHQTSNLDNFQESQLDWCVCPL